MSLKQRKDIFYNKIKIIDIFKQSHNFKVCDRVQD